MEHPVSDSKYTSLLLFDVFQDALADLIASDKYLFTRQKNKSALSHRLTEHLEQRLRLKLALPEDDASLSCLMFPKNMVFDTQVNKADIIFHDRSGKILMTIMLYNGYITGKQAKQLKAMHNARQLTMAVAFLPGKTYQLLYKVNRETIDYYHYDSTLKTSRLRMQKIREDDDSGQLVLLAPHKKKTTPKKS